MKILVTGCNGQLGTELRKVLERELPGVTTYVDIDTVNLTDPKAVDDLLAGPDGPFTHIVNCAAYTAVDRAEEEKLECAAANIDIVRNLAKDAVENGTRIVHISTDYVFDGNAHRPYTESDKVNPVSHYGSTKRKGETALLGLAPDSIIIRTGWLYSSHNSNFMLTMLRLADSKSEVRVVSDQVGTPTNAADLAEAIVKILRSRQWIAGTYNYSNEGVCSWYDFAHAIMRIAGKQCKVVPILSADYPTAATRPYYSVLDKTRIKGVYDIKIPHWEDSLQRCIDELKQTN